MPDGWMPEKIRGRGLGASTGAGGGGGGRAGGGWCVWAGWCAAAPPPPPAEPAVAVAGAIHAPGCATGTSSSPSIPSKSAGLQVYSGRP